MTKYVLEGLLMCFVFLLHNLHLLLSLTFFFVNNRCEVFARRDAAWLERRIVTDRQIQDLLPGFRLLDIGIKISLSIGSEQLLMRASNFEGFFLMLLFDFFLLFFLFDWTLNILELFILVEVDLRLRRDQHVGALGNHLP